MKYTRIFILSGCISILLSACTKDLTKLPTNGISGNTQFSSLKGYQQGYATIFGNLVYSNGGFLRHYWNMQEVSTDEAINTWNDDGNVNSYHFLSWSADLPALSIVYTQMLSTITLCNNFIIEASDDRISARGITGVAATTVQQYRNEARFLRAFCYWVLMDAYGNPPFATEANLTLGSTPKQILRKDLFNYLEKELNSLELLLVAPGSNEWGRPDKAAAWALLARMYLNAAVYTGSARYTDAISYCNKIIGSNAYALLPYYSWLMLADNNSNNREFIFTINYDNATEISWGTTNFLALGQANLPASINGMSSSWNSFRFTQSIPALFPSADTSIDKRAQFYTQGQAKNVTQVSISTDGYSGFKYRNVNRNGIPPVQNNAYNNISDIDFPVFRLAEIYLTYAEAVLRGGAGGDAGTALRYINQLRGRAYAADITSNKGNINASDLTLDFIIDERARELYWEALRRTDLIRFNRLTSNNYLWAWKGGVINGTGADARYNIFPIPSSDLLVNPHLQQNPGF
jgi:starch-binding outer membrane protein, SusD/RagB family